MPLVVSQLIAQIGADDTAYQAAIGRVQESQKKLVTSTKDGLAGAKDVFETLAGFTANLESSSKKLTTALAAQDVKVGKLADSYTRLGVGMTLASTGMNSLLERLDSGLTARIGELSKLVTEAGKLQKQLTRSPGSPASTSGNLAAQQAFVKLTGEQTEATEALAGAKSKATQAGVKQTQAEREADTERRRQLTGLKAEIQALKELTLAQSDSSRAALARLRASNLYSGLSVQDHKDYIDAAEIADKAEATKKLTAALAAQRQEYAKLLGVQERESQVSKMRSLTGAGGSLSGASASEKEEILLLAEIADKKKLVAKASADVIKAQDAEREAVNKMTASYRAEMSAMDRAMFTRGRSGYTPGYEWETTRGQYRNMPSDWKDDLMGRARTADTIVNAAGLVPLTEKLHEVHSQIDALAGAASAMGQELSFAVSLPIGAVVKLGTEFDDLEKKAKIAMTSVFTTSGEQAEQATQHANRMIHDLQEFAIHTPMPFTDVLDYARRLMALGVDAGKTIPMLKSIGDGLAQVGAGRDVMQRVIYDMGEMLSIGHADARMLRQLAMANVPVWKYLTQAINDTNTPMKQFGGTIGLVAKQGAVTESQMHELVKQGLVPAQWAIQALSYEMEHHAPGAMNKMAQTIEVGMTNIKDASQQVLGEVFKPIYDPLTVNLQKWSLQLFHFRDQVRLWGSDVKQHLAAGLLSLASVGPVFVGLGAGLRILTLFTSPIGLLAAAVGAVTYHILSNKDAVEEFAKILKDNLPAATRAGQSAMQALDRVGSALAPMFMQAVPALVSFLNVGTKILELFANLSPTSQRFIVGMGLVALTFGRLLNPMELVKRRILGIVGLGDPLGVALKGVGENVSLAATSMEASAVSLEKATAAYTAVMEEMNVLNARLETQFPATAEKMGITAAATGEKDVVESEIAGVLASMGINKAPAAAALAGATGAAGAEGEAALAGLAGAGEAAAVGEGAAAVGVASGPIGWAGLLIAGITTAAAVWATKTSSMSGDIGKFQSDVDQAVGKINDRIDSLGGHLDSGDRKMKQLANEMAGLLNGTLMVDGSGKVIPKPDPLGDAARFASEKWTNLMGHLTPKQSTDYQKYLEGLTPAQINQYMQNYRTQVAAERLQRGHAGDTTPPGGEYRIGPYRDNFLGFAYGRAIPPVVDPNLGKAYLDKMQTDALWRAKGMAPGGGPLPNPSYVFQGPINAALQQVLDHAHTFAGQCGTFVTAMHKLGGAANDLTASLGIGYSTISRAAMLHQIALNNVGVGFNAQGAVPPGTTIFMPATHAHGKAYDQHYAEVYNDPNGVQRLQELLPDGVHRNRTLASVAWRNPLYYMQNPAEVARYRDMGFTHGQPAMPQVPGLAPHVADWESLIQKAATENNIDPRLYRAFMSAESEGINVRPNSYGATGLMQVIPKYHNTTAAAMMDPAKNLAASGVYQNQLATAFGANISQLDLSSPDSLHRISEVVAGYHAGDSKTTLANIAAGKMGPKTRAYVNQVMSLLQSGSADTPSQGLPPMPYDPTRQLGALAMKANKVATDLENKIASANPEDGYKKSWFSEMTGRVGKHGDLFGIPKEEEERLLRDAKVWDHILQARKDASANNTLSEEMELRKKDADLAILAGSRATDLQKERLKLEQKIGDIQDASLRKQRTAQMEQTLASERQAAVLGKMAQLTGNNALLTSGAPSWKRNLIQEMGGMADWTGTFSDTQRSQASQTYLSNQGLEALSKVRDTMADLRYSAVLAGDAVKKQAVDMAGGIEIWKSLGQTIEGVTLQQELYSEVAGLQVAQSFDKAREALERHRLEMKLVTDEVTRQAIALSGSIEDWNRLPAAMREALRLAASEQEMAAGFQAGFESVKRMREEIGLLGQEIKGAAVQMVGGIAKWDALRQSVNGASFQNALEQLSVLSDNIHKLSEIKRGNEDTLKEQGFSLAHGGVVTDVDRQRLAVQDLQDKWNKVSGKNTDIFSGASSDQQMAALIGQAQSQAGVSPEQQSANTLALIYSALQEGIVVRPALPAGTSGPLSKGQRRGKAVDPFALPWASWGAPGAPVQQGPVAYSPPDPLANMLSEANAGVSAFETKQSGLIGQIGAQQGPMATNQMALLAQEMHTEITGSIEDIKKRGASLFDPAQASADRFFNTYREKIREMLALEANAGGDGSKTQSVIDRLFGEYQTQARYEDAITKITDFSTQVQNLRRQFAEGAGIGDPFGEVSRSLDGMDARLKQILNDAAKATDPASWAKVSDELMAYQNAAKQKEIILGSLQGLNQTLTEALQEVFSGTMPKGGLLKQLSDGFRQTMAKTMTDLVMNAIRDATTKALQAKLNPHPGTGSSTIPGQTKGDSGGVIGWIASIFGIGGKTANTAGSAGATAADLPTAMANSATAAVNFTNVLSAAAQQIAADYGVDATGGGIPGSGLPGGTPGASSGAAQYMQMFQAGMSIASAAGLLANGGPAMGGSSYIVGERGPEVFVPSSSGTVIPNHMIDWSALSGARAMGGDVYGGRSYLVGEGGPEAFVPRGGVASAGGSIYNVNMNVHAQDAASFNRSRSQIMAQIVGELQRADQRNN